MSHRKHILGIKAVVASRYLQGDIYECGAEATTLSRSYFQSLIDPKIYQRQRQTKQWKFEICAMPHQQTRWHTKEHNPTWQRKAYKESNERSDYWLKMGPTIQSLAKTNKSTSISFWENYLISHATKISLITNVTSSSMGCPTFRFGRPFQKGMSGWHIVR
jgi:hypothetical protein